MRHKIATIINYCSNEYRFLYPCLQQAKIFSSQIILPVCDHFFDGTKEDFSILEKSFSLCSQSEFILYPLLKELERKKIFKKIGQSHFWHSLSRFIAAKYLAKEIEYVLFLDADEVVDGQKFLTWLDTLAYQNFSSIKFSNYWYFRSEAFQAKNFEDSAVMLKKECLSKKNLLQKEERNALFDLSPYPKTRQMMGKDDLPMIHHYSWVRSKEEMLKKVRAWGHKEDRNWESLVEEEFSKEFSGKDFVHGYEFATVEPFIDLTWEKKLFRLSGDRNQHNNQDENLEGEGARQETMQQKSKIHHVSSKELLSLMSPWRIWKNFSLGKAERSF